MESANRNLETTRMDVLGVRKKRVNFEKSGLKIGSM
jgi:hypothetical protein